MYLIYIYGDLDRDESSPHGIAWNVRMYRSTRWMKIMNGNHEGTMKGSMDGNHRVVFELIDVVEALILDVELGYNINLISKRRPV